MALRWLLLYGFVLWNCTVEFSKAETIFESKYEPPGTSIVYFTRIRSEFDRDTVHISHDKGKNYQLIFKGTIKGLLHMPDTKVVSGERPSRLTTWNAEKNSQHYTFFSEGRIHISTSGVYIGSYPVPRGVVSTYSWIFLDAGALGKFLLISTKTDEASEVRLIRPSDGYSIVLARENLGVKGVKIENGVLTWNKLTSEIDLTQLESYTHLVSTPSDSETESYREARTRLENSSVRVADSEGKQAKAWDLVSGFVSLPINILDPKVEDGSPVQLKLEQIYRNLLKQEIGSVKILGPAGSGKTYLANMLVSQLTNGHPPPGLEGYIPLIVNPSALSAGTKYSGSMSARINAMIALSKEFNIVWIIDEAHTLSGQGTHSHNAVDITQKLKPGLTEGFLRFVALSTEHEWNNAYAGDPPWDERFGKVKVQEPMGEELFLALENFIARYKFPEIDRGLLALIIRLSDQFNATGAQPRKANQLIEEIFADQKLQGELKSPSREEILVAASGLYDLHPDHFDREKMLQRLRNLPQGLSRWVVGQTEAKEAIVNGFEMSIAGLEDKTKPKGRAIFAGPKGQGKTELVKAAAKVLETSYVRIMMTSYTHPNQTENLKREIAQALRKHANA
ncbi:MAG: AAA family ATPase, partial [Bdellovibrionales bacterium]|nr:AAA family ATPase [Bdellovibrionales bacterium]